MSNIGVLPSIDPSKVPVATRTLTVNGTASIDVPYGLVGYEGGSSAYVPIDATHGMPVGLVDSTPAGVGTISAADAGSTTVAGPSGQTLVVGSPTAGSTVVFTLSGQSAYRLQITGTFSATLAVEGSSDGGTTWVSKGGFFAGTAVTGSSTTTPAIVEGIAAGVNRIRVRCTAYVSGTPAIVLYATAATGEVKVESPIRLFDAVSGSQGTIKAASTAVIATDTALSVGLHPSTPLPAGTALLGVTISPQQTGALYSGTTALTPKFASIVASSSGATTVVAAVTSKKIRVLKFTLSANGAVNAKFQSHVTPTDLTGLFYLAANGGVGGSYCPLGHFETVSGEALDINLSGSVAVGGVLTYVEV